MVHRIDYLVHTGLSIVPHTKAPQHPLQTMKTAKSFRHFFGGLVAAAVSMLIMPFPIMAEEKTLATFESEDCLEAWTSVNDGVMGGFPREAFHAQNKEL